MDVDRKNDKRNTIAIKNQLCNQTWKEYIRTDLLGLCRGQLSLIQLNLFPYYSQLAHFIRDPTHSNPIFQPTLYKFIVLGFLGLGASIVRASVQSLALTLIIWIFFIWIRVGWIFKM